jgi:glutamate:Na+ symporter, ESS family
VIELDLVQTLAFGGVALLVGYGLRRAIPVLGRYNLPAPVIGGLLIAVVILVARSLGTAVPVKFDTTLQAPLMIAFFTTIGFGASLSLLKKGGPQLVVFLVIAILFAIAQNLLGMLVSAGFGLHPLFGVLAGSVTLTGGPATGLAFAPLFEEAGVPAAASIAVAMGMAGIVAGGIVGSPAATALIEKYSLRPTRATRTFRTVSITATAEVDPNAVPDDVTGTPENLSAEDDVETFAVLKNVVLILVAMWVGSWISAKISAMGVILPPYIGAMLIAALIRNIDDFTGWIGLSHKIIDVVGAVALSLFLVLALMTLKLWELAALAAPLVVNLVLQVVLVVAACRWIVFRLMGRDYEAAVMSGGFIGFMLGTTANAMAVMGTLAERYGPAPRAFLVAPVVGAFFIDFANALIITTFVNFLR